MEGKQAVTKKPAPYTASRHTVIKKETEPPLLNNYQYKLRNLLQQEIMQPAPQKKFCLYERP